MFDLVTIAGFLVFTVILLLADPIVSQAVITLLGIILLAGFGAPLIPHLVNYLANKPNEFRPVRNIDNNSSLVDQTKRLANVGTYEASKFGFFTFIKPGRVKAIVRGERFRRFIMRYDGYTFKGDVVRNIPQNTREYWNVIATPRGEDDSHPIPKSIRKGHLDIMWWWSRWVYFLTGGVFTGIPPFQTVETYELEQLIKVIDDSSGATGSYQFIPWKDYSDHIRAAEYQFFVQLPEVETRDQVKVRLQFALTILIVNPYCALYDTDTKWASRLFTAVVSEVTSAVGRLGYKQVTSRTTQSGEAIANLLIQPILALNDTESAEDRDAEFSLKTIGMVIKAAELIGADVTDAKLAAALADEAVSLVDRQAELNRSEGKAGAINNIAQAARKHGAYGELALRTEATVRTADAASKNGGTVILTAGESGTKVDPQIAMLRESIEKGNKK